MEKYKVQMVNKYTEEVVEDLVDDQVFDSEEDAQEYASYLNGCAAQGAEILKLSNPITKKIMAMGRISST